MSIDDTVDEDAEALPNPDNVKDALRLYLGAANQADLYDKLCKEMVDPLATAQVNHSPDVVFFEQYRPKKAADSRLIHPVELRALYEGLESSLREAADRMKALPCKPVVSNADLAFFIGEWVHESFKPHGINDAGKYAFYHPAYENTRHH